MCVHPVRITRIHVTRFSPRVGLPRKIDQIGTQTGALRFSKIFKGLGPKMPESFNADWVQCFAPSAGRSGRESAGRVWAASCDMLCYSMYIYTHTYIYIYIYTYIHICLFYIYIYICILHYSILYAQSPYEHCGFQRVLPQHNLKLKGWNSHVHRKFTGKFESSNVSRDHVSREIGRMTLQRVIL